MSKYRIAVVDWHTKTLGNASLYAVQIRVAFFWWITVVHCETFFQATAYIDNLEREKMSIKICKPS